MNANVSKLLNEQINKEFYSAYFIWTLPTTTPPWA